MEELSWTEASVGMNLTNEDGMGRLDTVLTEEGSEITTSTNFMFSSMVLARTSSISEATDGGIMLA
jgi:hypothetical protein